MMNFARRTLARPAAISLALTVLLVVGASALPGSTRPARAGQADRLAIVLAYFDAQNRGDVDAAVAQFADTAVFIGARTTGNCSQRAPCTDLAGIRQQQGGNAAIHACDTIRTIQIAGEVITVQREARTDTTRINGVERALATVILVIPRDKITFFVAIPDLADPQTALNAAINAGTAPAGTPIPTPNPPCG